VGAHRRDDHMQGQCVPRGARQVGTQVRGCVLQLLVRQQVVQVDNARRIRKVLRPLHHRPDVHDLVLHAHDQHGDLEHKKQFKEEL